MHQKDQRQRANLRRVIRKCQKEIGYIYILKKKNKTYPVNEKRRKNFIQELKKRLEKGKNK